MTAELKTGKVNNGPLHWWRDEHLQRAHYTSDILPIPATQTTRKAFNISMACMAILQSEFTYQSVTSPHVSKLRDLSRVHAERLFRLAFVHFWISAKFSSSKLLKPLKCCRPVTLQDYHLQFVNWMSPKLTTCKKRLSTARLWETFHLIPEAVRCCIHSVNCLSCHVF